MRVVIAITIALYCLLAFSSLGINMDPNGSLDSSWVFSFVFTCLGTFGNVYCLADQHRENNATIALKITGESIFLLYGM